MLGFSFLAMVLPLTVLGVKRNQRGMRGVQVAACFVMLGLTLGLAACGGSGSNSQPTPSKPVQESGTKTILVNATCGTVTRTVPLVLNIQ
jgi:hypothetical protein